MSELAESIRGLYKSEKYADLSIRCEGIVFKVHCVVVCTRSSFLATAVDGQFKGAGLHAIDLPDDELPIVEAMIEYLYTGNYKCSGQEIFGHYTNDSLIFHVKVYIAANEFDIPALKVLVKEKFETYATENWNCASFSEATKMLWENTMDSDFLLREVVVMIASKNAHSLLDRGEFVELITVHGSFGLAVLRTQLGLLWYDGAQLPQAILKEDTPDFEFGNEKTLKKGKNRIVEDVPEPEAVLEEAPVAVFEPEHPENSIFLDWALPKSTKKSKKGKKSRSAEPLVEEVDAF